MHSNTTSSGMVSLSMAKEDVFYFIFLKRKSYKG
jgi:hypothetical protein